jgi:Flp pilus assembly protein TadD
MMSNDSTEVIEQEHCGRLPTPLEASELIDRGQLHLRERDWDLAITCFREALSTEPDAVELHLGLGTALLGSGLPEAALLSYRAALSRRPRHAEACRQYVYALELLSRSDDAVGAWFSLGAALEAEDRFSEAATAYQQAVAHKPDCLRALIKQGQMHIMLAHPEDALPCFESALTVDAAHPDARVGRAWCRQLLGDISFGWEDFAWWTDSSNRKRRYLEQPAWDGSSLEGRTILLWCDGGLGDHLHLFRYVKILKALGARVIVECAPRLVSLAQQMEGADSVIAKRMPLPRIDFHAPLLLLPGLLRLTRETVPAAPYLRVDPGLVDEWRLRLCASGEKTVGIVWASGGPQPSARYTSLAAFSALADVPGIRLISLQRGQTAAELASRPSNLKVDVFPEESRSVCDTAALIMNLDLLISVDTMVAHLGGGLGRRVWTLLSRPANWRWQSGDTTPWYPSMSLFRQTRAREWTDVFQRVRTALVTSLEDGTI